MQKTETIEREKVKNSYDLLDGSKVYRLSDWEPHNCITRYEHCYKCKAMVIAKKDFAEYLGVPNNAELIGDFKACWDGEPDNPDNALWDYYDMENFEIVGGDSDQP